MQLFTILATLYNILGKNERRRASALFAMLVIMALLDLIGIASIFPFMAVATDPSVVSRNIALNKLYLLLGFANQRDFLIFLGFGSAALILVSQSFRATTLYFQYRFTTSCEYKISTRLLSLYLKQPYKQFLQRNSSELSKLVLSETETLVHSGIMPAATLLAQVMMISLIGLLLFLDLFVTLTIITVLGGTYAVIYFFCIKRLKTIAISRQETNKKRYQSVTETFGAMKEIKVAGNEEIFIKKFSEPAAVYANAQATAMILGQIPRYVLEALALVGMIAVAIYFLLVGSGYQDVIPTLSLFALVGYRLMPALQQIYQASTQLRYAAPIIMKIDHELTNTLLTSEPTILQESKSNKIEIHNLTFTYPGTDVPSVKNLTVNISTKTAVALIGKTGSGKSTIADLLLGILNPDSGSINYGTTFASVPRRTHPKKGIGYVPQQIYLLDDSIAANIAFGQDPNVFDHAAIKSAAKAACIDQFIELELSLGYKTTVGDRGLRLSGGQKQRIGIARALYRRPSLLVLDEATNALDSVTERQLLKNIMSYDELMTIIMITHRLSTVVNCNEIILLHQGEIVARGNFKELETISGLFKEMLLSSNIPTIVK